MLSIPANYGPGFKILARYSGWPGLDNNMGCSARLKASFELNPVTDGKQLTLPYIGPFLCDE